MWFNENRLGLSPVYLCIRVISIQMEMGYADNARDIVGEIGIAEAISDFEPVCFVQLTLLRSLSRTNKTLNKKKN